LLVQRLHSAGTLRQRLREHPALFRQLNLAPGADCLDVPEPVAALLRQYLRDRSKAPPAVLADTLGVSAGTAMHRAVLGGADWSACAAHRHAPTSKELHGDGQPVRRT